MVEEEIGSLKQIVIEKDKLAESLEEKLKIAKDLIIHQNMLEKIEKAGIDNLKIDVDKMKSINEEEKFRFQTLVE